MLVVLEATAQTSHLTLDDALSLGFERNPAVVATEYAEQAAHRERQAAIGLFMPKISVKGAYAHLNRDIKIDFNPMLSSFAPILGEGLAMLGLDLSYTLQRRNTAFLGGDVEGGFSLGIGGINIYAGYGEQVAHAVCVAAHGGG